MKEDMDFSEEFLSLHEIDDDPYVEEGDDSEEDLKKVKKKKKKEKKRKLKSFDADKMDLLMEDIEIGLNDFDEFSVKEDDDEYIIKKKGKKGKKIDPFDVKQAKKQKKKNIEAKFNPELLLLKKTLKDADLAVEDIKDVLKNIKNSKARYVGKTLTDLFQALNSANSTRASIIRDMTNIKKTVVDLGMKQDKLKPNKKKDDELDKEELGVNFFSQIFGKGSRKDLLDEAGAYFNQKNNASESDIGMGGDYYIEDTNELDDIINSRLEKEGNPYRESEGTSYIQYENMRPEDCVRYISQDEWEMDAIDANGNSMPDDYPRLNKDDVGKLVFNFEDGVASDSHGRRFRIIQ